MAHSLEDYFHLQHMYAKKLTFTGLCIELCSKLIKMKRWRKWLHLLSHIIFIFSCFFPLKSKATSTFSECLSSRNWARVIVQCICYSEHDVKCIFFSSDCPKAETNNITVVWMPERVEGWKVFYSEETAFYYPSKNSWMQHEPQLDEMWGGMMGDEGLSACSRVRAQVYSQIPIGAH